MELLILGREKRPRQFNLIRWFSLISLCVIATVSIMFAIVTTRFVMTESIERDVMLTAQFIQANAAAELRHAKVGPGLTMGALLDPRREIAGSPDWQEKIANLREEFLEDLAQLPDARLAHIFAPDRVIVWSSNPQLIGKQVTNENLEQAFATRSPVSASYSKVSRERIEQRFLEPPAGVYIENYIPLLDEAGNVTAMVEIYKEPADLIARIRRGYWLLWLVAAISGAMIYAGLFWIIWRASDLLACQQKQLVANETLVALGEMSSAVAHSLRNPLAAIRTSAELALDVDISPARKNIEDIIGQVDRLARWVRGLLLSVHPLSDEQESVDPVAGVNDALNAFAEQIRQAGIRVEWSPQPAPAVISHPVLLAQALNSILANAIEAMPRGGLLQIRLATDSAGRSLELSISDTGNGMSSEQIQMAFKAFYTTKRSGLGVGLVLVKRIMERFGGEVRLYSREKEGTLVVLAFRIAEQG